MQMFVIFVGKKNRRFLDFTQKMESTDLVLDKIWKKKKKQISRNWPGLLCAEGALPLMATDSLQIDVNTNLLLV